MSDLGPLANIAAILTAFVAVLGYGYYLCDRRKKQILLENYLKAEKDEGENKGQRTLLHLMAKLGMTEAELLQASFRSEHIERRIAKDDETGRAEELLLEWKN